MEDAIVVLAKAPLAGLSKTRLQRETGLPAASIAGIATAFLEDVLAHCARVEEARVTVAFAPAASREVFAALAPSAVLVDQVEGDLGQRMQAAFAAAFQGGARRVVLLGTDAPHLGPATIRGALAALERAPCAIVPAEDGGYCALALDRPRTELLEGVPWSTRAVLAVTLAKARAAELRVELLAPEFDVDARADLERLAALISVSPERAPATARVLATWRRRPQ